MVDFSTLTPENINMFAMKHYDNPTCVDEKEFLDDMKRFKSNKLEFKINYPENDLVDVPIIHTVMGKLGQIK